MTSEQEQSVLQPGSLLLTIVRIQSSEVFGYSKKQTAQYGGIFK